MMLLFICLYLLLCNWFQLKSFALAFSKKQGVSTISDAWISKTLLSKTGIKLDKITIFESQKLFGMMPSSLPFSPKIILSRSMYESFSKSELEWVILHEAGHYILSHGIKLGAAQLLSIIIGVSILSMYPSNVVSLILALVLTILYIRVTKFTEFEADSYSISRVDDPRGVISAQEKLIRTNRINQDSFFARYLKGQTLPRERMTLAEIRIQND